MQMLEHPNVCKLENSFYTNGSKNEVYLNLVMDYVPETIYRFARNYAKLKQPFPLLYTKLYMYQLLKALAYVHTLGVCHRDIKPQNLLLDPALGILKLCDFGSAKVLVPGETNVSYICSRYYRAPELIFGCTNYTTAIDMWSMGCVFAELLLGRPLFPGESGIHQLVQIIKVLGTPSREQVHEMNQSHNPFETLPEIKSVPWFKVFKQGTPPEAINLVSKLLQYTPGARLKPEEAVEHLFFEELKDPNTVMPAGGRLPPLLFYEVEVNRSVEFVQS